MLAERYSRFRLEVQTANDTGEAASYADCVRRVRQRESRTAKAAFGAPLSRTAAASSPAGEVSIVPFDMAGMWQSSALLPANSGTLTLNPHVCFLEPVWFIAVQQAWARAVSRS